jgi:hypothetical protein
MSPRGKVLSGGETMSTLYVRIPIAGSITIEVEADSEEAAKEAAWERINENSGEPEDIGEVEWGYFDVIVEGNCFHGPCNEIEVSK